MDANAKGETFDAANFSVRLPTEEGEEPPSGGESVQDCVFENLGSKDVLGGLKKFDANGDGRIDSDEQQEITKFQRGLMRDIEDGPIKIGAVKSPSFGKSVTLDDFSALMENFGVPEEMMQVIFERFDVDNDGALSPQELESAVEYARGETERKTEQKVANSNQASHTDRPSPAEYANGQVTSSSQLVAAC